MFPKSPRWVGSPSAPSGGSPCYDPTWYQLLDGAKPEPEDEEEDAFERPKPKAPWAIESWFPSATVQPGLEGEEQYLFTVVGTFE